MRHIAGIVNMNGRSAIIFVHAIRTGHQRQPEYIYGHEQIKRTHWSIKIAEKSVPENIDFNQALITH